MEQNLLERLKKQIIIFDGAMGTELMKRGLAPGECPETWNINHPEAVEDIHRAYIEAGADVIETNTFGANRIKLGNFGLSHLVRELNFRAVENAKKASGGRALVALSVGPTGELLEPHGSLSFEKALEVFREQIEGGLEAGPDMIVIETMSQLQEARAALIAARELTFLPVAVTMTYEESGRTLMGTDPATAIVVLSHLGADMVGLNCSLGPDKMRGIVSEMAGFNIPLIVQPNAGIPELIGEKTVYRLPPQDFAFHCRKLAEAGLNAVGGCCGTTPEHIRQLRQALSDMRPKGIKEDAALYASEEPDETSASASFCLALSSEKKTVFVSPGGEVKAVGDRINPTGNKVLIEDLKRKSLNAVVEKALMQKKAGAHILDVNLGVPGIDEKAIMRSAVLELQRVVDLPLCIDSMRADVLEEGLKVYAGRALVNSVNGSERKMARLFPIVKKYGAAVIALAMDEGGIPRTAEERVDIAKRIVRRAEEYGIKRQDVVIDCLSLTAGAQQEYVMEAMKTLQMVKEELGCLTTLGISNVSFGLPERPLLNRVFLSMALAYGLDLPILNPLDSDVWEVVRAAGVLTGRDRKAQRYITYYQGKGGGEAEEKKHDTAQALDHTPSKSDQDVDRKLYSCVLEGKKSSVAGLLETFVEIGKDPLEIVNKIIIPALKEVGEKYETGEYFLPQLIQSAEAAQEVFKLLKRRFPASRNMTRGKIVLATVKGDIHDIGKNIVKVIMENYGFEVIDLGKDVASEKITEVLRKTPDIRLVGLSALMTTSIPAMQHTIAEIKNLDPGCSVVVGGAVLTPALAEKIGADFYAKDAMEGVRVAEKIYRQDTA
ncbi:MAG: 5-methyltetrahydrofolate--homocysteine methyltransferase [Tepidanaerobacteraceae bacterium]|nr:5-methyltetrahydrofolate--homocysteine methyltransferase [Tepidanaerobacteraceae bacterium]